MNSIAELKNIILTFKDNISQTQVKAFDDCVLKLWEAHRQEPSALTLLKMMRTLNRYLSEKKSTAHKDALPLLESITVQLEMMIETPSLNESDIKKIVSEQISRYKNFQAKISSTPQISDNDLDNLTSAILAIDWEISEQTLKNFENVLLPLLSNLKGYRIHYSFLKIIHSTGRYIGIQKANAPTDSISFLRSVFENLKKIIQTKEMTFSEKKQLLEKDLQRFNEFKQRISTQKDHGQTSPKTNEPDSIMPALSHINKGSDSQKGELPVTALPEESISGASKEADHDEFEPALSGKTSDSGAQMDVMDDLFTVKETPADELLDAIHLMEVHGEKGQDQAMKMLDEADESNSDGLKKFTPQRKDTAPIDEIGSRLDEFFSLETPQEEPSGDLARVKETVTPLEDQIQEEDISDSIIPFDDEDEIIEDTGFSDASTISSESANLAVLKRLETSIKREGWKIDKNLVSEISEDIGFLKNAWEDDPEKSILLEIIAFGSGYSADHDHISEKNQDEKSIDKAPGIWGKIKSIFTS